MKKMVQTLPPKNKKIIVKVEKPKLRNELHFNACLNSNVAYIEKNKKKIIPRKQKYKEIY